MTEIQKSILLIYEEVRQLCASNNIPFFAIGGTCIGAIRHNGFIPWDDDLDIAIPIEDFDRFIQIAKTSLPDYLEVYSGKSVEHNKNFFIKIVDNRTTFIEEHEFPYPDAFKGVFVDIMPISGIPSNALRRHLFYVSCVCLYWANEFRRFPINNCKGAKRIIRKIVYAIIRNKPYDYFYNKYFSLLKRNPFRSSTLTGYVWCLQVRSLTFPTAFFAQTKEVKFEYTTVPCPIEADKYLTMQFGDYMKLPPQNEQVSNHDGIIILDRSYKDAEFIKHAIDNYDEQE